MKSDAKANQKAQIVKRAADHPKRPGEKCKAEPGRYLPTIDHARCEAKSDCVVVCPYDVFEIRRIDASDFSALSGIAKFKVWVHGMKTAYTPKADQCRACGLCVVACPEKAIALVNLPSA